MTARTSFLTGSLRVIGGLAEKVMLYEGLSVDEQRYEDVWGIVLGALTTSMGSPPGVMEKS